MALFKISRGSKENLPTVLSEGHCWYTFEDSLFYIDFSDENGKLVRKALNAQSAEKLTGYDIATILNSSDVEIPTSKAVLDAIEEIKSSINDATAAVLEEAQADASNKAVAVLAEAQKYTDAAIENINISEGFSGSYNDLTDKPEIPVVPTNVSAFENDAGYLTAIPEEYVTETYVDTAIANLATIDDVNNIIADFVEADPVALEALQELSQALENHEDAYDALLETVGNKATKTELEDVKNTAANYAIVALAEAQKYTDDAVANIELTPGADGISATHSWNGTTLTITSASGTSSANLKGEQGAQGPAGNPGYSPIRGTDYWTEADKEEIKAYARSYIEEVLLGGKW